MTDTPAPNDIPAILARADAWIGQYFDSSVPIQKAVVILAYLPNMASEILSLRADKKPAGSPTAQESKK